MLRKFASVIVAASVMGLVIAATAARKADESKGRQFFRQNCKECHSKGGKGGEVTPLSKTTAQWRAFFEKGTMGRHGALLGNTMSPDKLADVQAFLEAHAADSLQPEICGR